MKKSEMNKLLQEAYAGHKYLVKVVENSGVDLFTTNYLTIISKNELTRLEESILEKEEVNDHSNEFVVQFMG